MGWSRKRGGYGQSCSSATLGSRPQLGSRAGALMPILCLSCNVVRRANLPELLTHAQVQKHHGYAE